VIGLLAVLKFDQFVGELDTHRDLNLFAAVLAHERAPFDLEPHESDPIQ
jgi:hypothetical protein